MNAVLHCFAPRPLIVPRPPEPPSDADVSTDVWGFRDTRFEILEGRNTILTGRRYSLSGSELPELLPWIEHILGVELSSTDTHPSGYPPAVGDPVENPEFLRTLRESLPDLVSTFEPLVRLRHGHGHTLEEMYAIKYERLPRVPDLVAFPSTEDEVVQLVEAAVRHNVCLVPYGGGTNVTDALRCPEDEARMIVSVDLGQLNRILWIDPDNLTACIEGGAVGRHIQSALAEHGFTLGHEPDSIELSTLGGWIATHASGMKKNRYGNIEDILLEIRAVTPRGIVSRASTGPRESVGVDPSRWMLGSEGTLGIITSAVVKIWPLPEVERYDAILLPSFENGVAFLRDLARQHVLPASVRLVDNLQFQLSQTLKPRATGGRALLRRAQAAYVTRLRGFDPRRMVACTLVFEGSRDQVEREESAVRRIAARHGGLRAGAENGRKGYELTFGIAYLRDFVMRHHILAESFETSVSWTGVPGLCENVKRRIADEYAARRLPGTPFVTCRVTQLYQTGAAVYFYFGFYHKGVDEPTKVYAEIESAARDEILRSGGSLSHHHGVGKIRRDFLPRVFSPAARMWATEVKRAIDPMNIFGIGNQ